MAWAFPGASGDAHGGEGPPSQLHFTTGLKVLPTGDQTNHMMTQVAEVTVKCVN